MGENDPSAPEAELPEMEEAGGEHSRRPWNSLEIAKLAIAASIPIILFWFGHVFTQQQEHEAENRAAADQVVKQRLELWGRVAVPLNDIYCYFLYVGGWKTLSQDGVIARKRSIDQIVYAYRPFFSNRFILAYDHFMESCFKMSGHAPGIDAPLRTARNREKDKGSTPDAFTGQDNSQAIHEAYFALLNTVALEMNLPPVDPPKVPERPASGP